MNFFIPYLSAFFIGLVAGICSGLFGIGGGIVIIPFLTFGLGYSQISANGTSLVALLLPVGALGAYQYYSEGKISIDNVRIGLIIALGIFIASFFGAKLAISIPEIVLRKLFSLFLVLVAIKLWFS